MTVVSKIIGIFAIFTAMFLAGFFTGSDYQKTKNHEENMRNQKIIAEKVEENRVATQKHVSSQQELILQIQTLRKEYEKKLADVQFDYADRLRESEQRSVIYRQQQAASSDECRALAEHASRLDRSLTEGRELVTRVTGNLRQCELIFKEAVQYLINDRDHLNGR